MEPRDTRWISAAEVAEHLGVASDIVYRWTDRKGMPAHRVGHFYTFQLSEVDTLVKSGEADVPNGLGSKERLGDSTNEEH